MTDSKLSHIKMIIPPYESSLTDAVLDLQHLRKMKLGGTTPPPIFFQLKGIFHLLESLGSARIEGNRTTIAEVIESKINPSTNRSDSINEIENMERALSFIDDYIQQDQGITKSFILELHKITVKDLEREGDLTPGYYRNENVIIARAEHIPPDYMQVDSLMEDLLNFINQPHEAKYDLLKIALSHHRFAWIHPFRNGNGRVVRLLTYAMLIERGFNVKQGRILNPSAVFCIDRERYYNMLSKADTGEETALQEWCEYVLRGILEELTKIDKLLEYDFLAKKILSPAVSFAKERKLITELESKILEVAIEKMTFQASDIEKLIPNKLPQQRSRVLGKMKKNNLIEPIGKNSRKYVMGLTRGYLLRGIIKALEEENFISTNM